MPSRGSEWDRGLHGFRDIGIVVIEPDENAAWNLRDLSVAWSFTFAVYEWRGAPVGYDRKFN